MDDAHAKIMTLALKQAQLSGKKGEVPVGAVLVTAFGDILSQTQNQTIQHCDPTAHAEILAIREAAKNKANYRLVNTCLYVTMEPCIMCMGAIIHARIAMVVFGVRDPKWGAAGSLYHFAGNTRLNHHPMIIGGVCESESRELIQSFFREKRDRKKTGFTL